MAKKKREHTPGRFEFFSGHLIRAIQGENAIPIAELRTPYRPRVALFRGEREQQANGRLLAAAPDLLEALQRLTDAAAKCGNQIPWKTYSAARDAIEKAVRP